MKKKKKIIYSTLFLSVALLMSSFIFAKKNKKEDIITWSSERKLTWDDFQGKSKDGDYTYFRKETHGSAALSTIGIKSYFKFREGEKNRDLILIAYFSKKKSWGKVKSDFVLAHEQAHFDIEEIFARKIRKQIASTKFKEKSFAKNVQNLFEKINKEKDLFHETFDYETHKHLNQDTHEKWYNIIKTELRNLEKYSDSIVLVRIR